jgi:PAS domain S-box-containing protein
MLMEKICVALEKTKEPAFGVNAEGRICEWNEGAANMFGYSRSEAMRQSCAELLNCERDGPGDDPGDRRGERCDLLCCARENRMLSNRDRQMCDKWGRVLLVQISTLICHLENKDFVMVHLCRDVSREKRTEALLSEIMHLAAQLELLSELPERTHPT